MIVIIGSGLAGYTVAKELRARDKTVKITVISRDDGVFYSKPLLSRALTQDKSADALAMHSSEKMANDLDIQVLTHTTVERIDRTTKTIHHSSGACMYEYLVLACGATVRSPNWPGAHPDHFYAVNDLVAYRLFRQRLAQTGCQHLAIVGSGLVGCEFANDLLNGGYRVSMIAKDPLPLSSMVPEAVGSRLLEALREKGLHWYGGTVVDQQVQTAEGYALALSSGAQCTVDVVLSAIGLQPEWVLAAQAGLSVSHAISVDRYLRTSDPSIYALGDCAAVEGLHLQYVPPLMACARALAATLSGTLTQVIYPVMPVVVKTPAFPIVCVPVPRDIDGHWQVEGTEKNLKAQFFDSNEQLRGFVLTGDCIAEKQTLALSVLPLFSA